MSKAEERARDLGYGTDPLNRAEYTANEVREAFIEGYHQAEKDIELTWNDLAHICSIAYIYFGEFTNEKDRVPSNKELYEEVLKRFKFLKGLTSKDAKEYSDL